MRDLGGGTLEVCSRWRECSMQLGVASRHLVGNKGWSLWKIAKSVGVSTAGVARECYGTRKRDFRILRVFVKAYLPEVHIYKFHRRVIDSACTLY